MTGIKGGQVKVLSDDELNQIHLATLEVLETVGIKTPHRKALDYFSEAGCQVDYLTGIAKVPGYVLMDALARAPKRITLYGKTPEFDVVLDGTPNVYTLGGAGATMVIDLDGNRRPSTLDDLIKLTRLQEDFENLNLAHFLVLPQDIPQQGSDRVVFSTMLQNTRRHHHTIAAGAQGVRDHVEMAAVLAGSKEAVSARPFYMENICVHSPLYIKEDTVDEIFEAAKYRIPMLMEADSIAGGTSPFTIAGAAVEVNATVLAGIMLAQLATPGSPCIYSSSSGILDMRVANYSAAAPESTLLHMVGAQMAHFYGLPYQGANTCDSKVSDAQMGYERALHFLSLAYAGCNIIHVATGNLEQMRLASYEQCLLDNEILGATFRILKGLTVDRDTLAVDVFKDIGPGPGGQFIDHDHTLRHLRRERWEPRLTSREPWETWQAHGGLDMRQRANVEARRILEQEWEPYVSEDQAHELDKMAKTMQQQSMDSTRRDGHLASAAG